MSRPRKRKAFGKPDQPLPALRGIPAGWGTRPLRTRPSYPSPSNYPMADWLQLGKEQGQLAGGRLAGVGAVDQVLLDLQAVVAADGPGRGGDGVGRAHQGAHGADRLRSLDAQRDQRPGGDEGDQVTEERLALVLGVVPLGGGPVEAAQLHGEQPEALALQPADDLADQAAGDRVGLAQDQGAFVGHGVPPEGGKWGDSTQLGQG